MRPLNFTTVEQTFALRKLLLERILRMFPRRRFVLIGDTSNRDVMSGYPMGGYPGVAKAALTSSACCSATSPLLTTDSPTAPAPSTASTAQSTCSSGTPDDRRPRLWQRRLRQRDGHSERYL